MRNNEKTTKFKVNLKDFRRFIVYKSIDNVNKPLKK